MEFRILGPLEVISDGQAFDLGGAKQRALLAVLLLHANEVVSRDVLIDDLWEDAPPESGPKALQVYVSGLRKVLGRERIETREPGYLLNVKDSELDLARFISLREEGRPAEALALWRGPPLSDFAYSRFAQGETARLEDLRLACLEERIEDDLRAGRHGALTGELEALVSEHPLRERLRAQSMLALYRSDRQADALAVYQDARGALVEELGIEPGKPLRDLHQAILNQDPGLDLPLPDVPPRAESAIADVPAAPARTSPAREVRKTITAVFFALGISSGGDRTVDPEALRRVTGQALDVVRDAVGRHGGALETVAGDSVTAVFGLPAVHEDDALRAVRAAGEVRQRLSSLGAELAADGVLELEFRVGIGTGEIVAGGDEDGVGAIGEPLTRSSALAREAHPGTVMIDDPTRRLLREAIVVEPAGEVWRVLEVAAGAAAPSGRLDAPMVGRGRELRRLRDAFEQAVGDRSCQLFTVLGAAGVGKSRLVRELLHEIEGRALIARGRCLPYGEGITYWPLMEALKDTLGLDDGFSQEEARAKLEEAFAGGDGTGAATAPLHIAELVDPSEAFKSAEGGFAAVKSLFETLARREALLLVFDDIHWAEPLFLDLIEYLADWTRDVPMLLVCLARPELLEVRPGWGGGKLNATSTLLEPLSETESEELIDSLTGTALEASARQRIVGASEGNPLFVEEMLALALEGGSGDEELVVPPTIHALIAARLDRLHEDERSLMDVAAVQGKVFYEDAVHTLLAPESEAKVSSLLGSLLHKDLIRPDPSILGGRAYRFRHLLIRDAAYDSIPKEARSGFHEGFARWFEAAAGEDAVGYEEIVGYHLEQAYRYRAELGTIGDEGAALAREAAALLGAAGRRAYLRNDAPAGVKLVSRAAALLATDDPARVDLIPNVRTIQGTGGDMSWADRVLTEAVEAAATSGDRRVAAQALVQRGLLRLFTDSDVTADELIDVADRSIGVFEELGDDLGLARAWRLKAQAHYLDRQLARCAETSERALEHARRAGDVFEERETAEWLVIALLLGPATCEEAIRRCQGLLEEESNIGPAIEALTYGVLGALMAMQGDQAAADEWDARSVDVMQQSGESVWIVTFWRSMVLTWRGDAAAAEAVLSPGYEAFKRIGEGTHFSSLSEALAGAVYAQGRYDEAEQLTRECEASAGPNDVQSNIMWRAVRAKVLARRGDLDGAEVLAREALELADGSDFLLAHANALVDLAEVLGLASRPHEAADALRRARDLYEQKGDVLVAETTIRLLAELEA
jgi:DNA-binding SARP family transcriptional activator/class 3 adenylate cyclase/tetratricopeptide (TPR) repeat protein